MLAKIARVWHLSRVPSHVLHEVVVVKWLLAEVTIVNSFLCVDVFNMLVQS
jgi:hypothetical protein